VAQLHGRYDDDDQYFNVSFNIDFNLINLTYSLQEDLLELCAYLKRHRPDAYKKENFQKDYKKKGNTFYVQ